MKKILVSVVIICFIGGVGYYKYDQYKHPDKYKETVTEETKQTATTTGTNSTSGTTSTAAETSTTVNIQPDQPIGGTLKGVIEVGASGFNSFVVNIDKDKNWELVDKQFGESLAYEGFATADDVKLGLKKYLSSIFSKGVSGRNAHFVMSSGALKNPKTQLIANSIEQMGYVVNRVTAEQEGKYALKALLPRAYRSNSFTVDIGSGNTKVSWYEGDKLKTVESFGAKYYQNNTPDAQVFDDITKAIKSVPEANRKNCFLIGGVPFQLAKENKGNGRYTALRNPDNYSAGTDVKMKSGLNIYRAIYEASSSDQYVFDWDANFTIGFLMSLN